MKAFKFGIVLVALLSLILSACGAVSPVQTPVNNDVWAIQTQTTLYYLQQAAAGKVGTYIYQNLEGDLMFVWNMKDQGFGFTMMSARSSAPAVQEWLAATGGQSNLVNTQTAKDLAGWLKDNGWKAIPASALNETVKQAIKQAARATAAEALAYLEAVGGSLVSFFVYPVGVFDSVPFPGEVLYDS